MFIDEAYSLGNAQNSDSFSKECIDTINQNLTEKKNQFLCIVAGYKEDLENCFFAYNSGLKRRFPFVYTIEPYNAEELYTIFKCMIESNTSNWAFDSNDSSVIRYFFKDNLNVFTNMAGDMETLFFYTKISHSRRVFGIHEDYRHLINLKDVQNGFTMFQLNRQDSSENNKKNRMSESLSHMYT